MGIVLLHRIDFSALKPSENRDRSLQAAQEANGIQPLRATALLYDWKGKSIRTKDAVPCAETSVLMTAKKRVLCQVKISAASFTCRRQARAHPPTDSCEGIAFQFIAGRVE